MSFPENLRQRPPELPTGVADSSPTSFAEKLRQTRTEALARNADPWHLRLERVHTKPSPRLGGVDNTAARRCTHAAYLMQ